MADMNQLLIENGDKDIYVRCGPNDFQVIVGIGNVSGELDGVLINFHYFSLELFGDEPMEVSNGLDN